MKSPPETTTSQIENDNHEVEEEQESSGEDINGPVPLGTSDLWDSGGNGGHFNGNVATGSDVLIALAEDIAKELAGRFPDSVHTTLSSHDDDGSGLERPERADGAEESTQGRPALNDCTQQIVKMTLSFSQFLRC